MLITELFQTIILRFHLSPKIAIGTIKWKISGHPKTRISGNSNYLKVENKKCRKNLIRFTSYLFLDQLKTVLKYIRNENKKSSVYIIHRISEIRTNSEIKDWNFISGVLNFTDHCTRPLSFGDLAKKDQKDQHFCLSLYKTFYYKMIVEDYDTAHVNQ